MRASAGSVTSTRWNNIYITALAVPILVIVSLLIFVAVGTVDLFMHPNGKMTINGTDKMPVSWIDGNLVNSLMQMASSGIPPYILVGAVAATALVLIAPDETGNP